MVILPWVFTCRNRAKEVGDKAYFTCNYCRNAGECETMAHAIRLDDDDDGTPNFSLVGWPRSANQHSSSCNPPPTEHLVREFRQLCYDAVKDDPTKSIFIIYKESRAKVAKDLSEDDKKSLFVDLPSFDQIQSSLYRHRINFIPREPKTYVCISTVYTKIILLILELK